MDFLNPIFSLAQLDWNSCSRNGIATLKCLPLVFQSIINMLIILGGITAVILVIFGGIKFLMSGGDPVKVEGAKKTVTFALIGLAIIILSFVLIKVISTVTGVRCSVLGINC
jgi:hypothetical protein